jgi:hydroxymethylglutaryl-CoA lyase
MDFSIYEVGPRDGLQSADTITPTSKKVELIERIVDAGIKNIEVGAMVSPEKVPNMADSALVYSRVAHLSDCNLGVLVPNKRGVERAKEVNVEKFNIFFSPSDFFNVNNFGRTLTSIFTGYCDALEKIQKENVRVYVSTSFGCPMAGEIPEENMRKTLEWADSLGSTIVLCDTVGKANPTLIDEKMRLTEDLDAKIALHLHHGPRKGRMSDNLSAAFDCGVTQFDSSIGGMGGCPFIPGSGGNLATEQLIEWGEKEGLDCGVTMKDIRPLSKYVNAAINI